MFPWVLLFVCVSLQTAFCTEQSCTTVDGKDGICITVERCEYYNSNDSLITDLPKEALCGLDDKISKVCCPVSPTKRERRNSRNPRYGRSDFVSELPSPPYCGHSNISLNKVVKGEKAKNGDLPWMALLGYNIAERISWDCTGALITVRHVLTAAHCMNKRISPHVVRLGELDISRDDDGAAPIDVPIKRLIPHEHYNKISKINDIGIIVLEKDVEFRLGIGPICLIQNRELFQSFEEFNPLLAGWGYTKEGGAKSSHLMAVQLVIENTARCANSYAPSDPQLIFDKRVICAGDGATHKDTCSGDSGGPLMISMEGKPNSTNYLHAAGVVAYGRGCGREQFPGVYTNVTYFMNWIEEKVLG